MAILRMDHVVLVVADLDAGIAFFEALGLELEGRTRVEGAWAERINALDDLHVEIAMMVTPDGHSKLELTRFDSPAATGAPEPPNRLGLRSVMFEVDDLAGSLERLAAHGGELVGEVADYEDVYRLCYVRGPGGAIIALAQALR
jgi:catechol 2,3-dioxygenase-like lactoylglutathione lyase family enzyme